MRIHILATLVLLLGGPATAAPNLQVGQVFAEAQGDVQRPVVVSVVVENRGDAESAEASAVVTLTPKVTPDKRKLGGMYAALPLTQPVPPIPAKGKVTLTFPTPYEARNSFRGQRGTFRCTNIDPTGDTVIEFKAVLQAGPAK